MSMKNMPEAIGPFFSWVFMVFMMSIKNKNERNDWGKCLGWPVTSYGPVFRILYNSVADNMMYSVWNVRTHIWWWCQQYHDMMDHTE